MTDREDAEAAGFQGGAWIPAYILHDNKLSADAKILAGRITALSNKRGHCWASNPYLADEFSVSERTIRNWLNELVPRHFVRSVEMGTKRKLTPRYFAERRKELSATRGERRKELSASGGKNFPHSIRVETTELELELHHGGSNGRSTGVYPKASNLKREPSGNFIYPPEFESAWSSYPDRKGSNPKKGAYRQWRKLVVDGVSPDVLRQAIEDYATYVRREKLEGERTVLQAQTFFGPDEHWNQDWKAKTKRRMPARYQQ